MQYNFLYILVVLLPWACFANPKTIIWATGTKDQSGAPAGKLLSDNSGYWGASIFTGVEYKYLSNPTNPPDALGRNHKLFGRRLLDGRIGGNWHIPVGQNHVPMVIVFDFKRPCSFGEIVTISMRTNLMKLKMEVSDTGKKASWHTVFEHKQTKGGGKVLNRFKIPTGSKGRFLRLSVMGTGGITWLDEVLVWGEAKVSSEFPENIAPTYTAEELPSENLTSIPGSKASRFSKTVFAKWKKKHALTSEQIAVWAEIPRTAINLSKAILPNKLNAKVKLQLARNESEHRYLALINTSSKQQIKLNINDIHLKTTNKIKAELLIGGAIPITPPKYRLTAEERLRLMIDDKPPAKVTQNKNRIGLLPFFHKSQMPEANMLQRYLTNGKNISNYPEIILPPGGAAVFMLRLSSKNAIPGIYQGEVSASTSSGRKLALKFQAEVFNIQLPLPDLWIRSWGNGTRQFPFESLERIAHDTQANRALGVTVWTGLPTPDSKAEKFGSLGKTYFHVHGLPNSYIHKGYSSQIKPEEFTDKDKNKIAKHLKSLVEKAKKLGLNYDQWFVELWDEPQKYNSAIFKVMAEVIRETDPMVRIYMNPLFWRKGLVPEKVVMNSLYPWYNNLIDISVPISVQAHRKKLRSNLWNKPRMVNALFLHPAARAGREISWQAFFYGMNGWGYYCYYAPRGNPWDIRTWNELNYSYQMVFPSSKGAVITPVYETIRDGWEDYRLLCALRENGRHSLLNKIMKQYQQKKSLTELRLKALKSFR